MSYPQPPSPAYPSAYPAGAAPGKVRLRGRVLRILGWTFLGLAVVLFVVGIVVVGTKSLGKVNGFQRITFASGQGTVNLDTGKYVGYYEASNVSDSIDFVPRFQAAVRGPNGPVNLQVYGNRSDGKIKKFTYDYNGHKGVAAFQFNAPVAGRYTIALREIDSLPSGADVAIGRDIAGGAIAGGVLIIISVVFGIVAIILLIIGYVKRSNHKGELQRGQYWGGVPAPAYGGQPPAGYGAPQGFAPPPGGYQAPPQQSPPEYSPPPAYNPPAYGEQPPPPGYQPPPPAQPGYQPPPPPPGEAPEQPSFGDPTAAPRDDSAER